jgi:hypothetical protein|tara:strand:- start:3201 stop:3362 length:162 start_codon:yes stop_codon:yes gene_type:complete
MAKTEDLWAMEIRRRRNREELATLKRVGKMAAWFYGAFAAWFAPFLILGIPVQ